VWAGSVPKEARTDVLSKCFNGPLENILGPGVPSPLSGGRISANYVRERFSDSLEFDGSDDEIQLRYVREGRAGDFLSYRVFLGASNLKGVVEGLRPFVEKYLSTAPSLSQRVRRSGGA